MKTLAQASALVALGIGGAAMAADFSYHYIEPALVITDAPGSNDGKGLAIAGSTDLPTLYTNATGFGGARYIDYDGGSLLNLEAGLGFHWPLSTVVDFNSGLSLEVNRYGGGGSNTDLGFGLNAGLRARPISPAWELDGGLKYVDIGHYDDTSIVLGTRYTFQRGMSAGIQLESGDIDYWTLSVRWDL